MKLLQQVRNCLRFKCYAYRTGHSDVSTTMIYTHVSQQGVTGVRSPLDALGPPPPLAGPDK